MKLADLFTILNGMQGFVGKVVYNAWEEGKAPRLPFICYRETQSNNFYADDKVYQKIQYIDIELYSKLKDSESEELIEETLNNNNLAWEKTETYLYDEKCFQIIYEISI